ncbi:tRNA modification GTPase [Algisphaera agarilytica]|uniref:tRNA modification GTPase n=2 Tax=Algisphaera agarilytica TaxID=1385975 RepID=A0A7X0H2W7_9BACT|nr:tRNA modification GTPase [Algisphaera agarilytica]
MAMTFPGPHSYTGGDVAELQLPGHPALLDRVIHSALGLGARLAEPGEFTFRAYAAGRLDLTQAEGVAATINAISDGQLAAATHLREGELARFSTKHVDRLGNLLALVEAGIDFVDQEDVVPIAPRDLARHLGELQTELSSLLQQSRSWGAVEALPRVVLVGPPSAGKSTLFNSLLGHPRAVIDADPGTTRDVLAEPMDLGGSEVMLVDVAGLESAESSLDRDVQQQARDAIRTADLLLVVGEAAELDHANCPQLRIQTKCDLSPEPISGRPDTDMLRVSGMTGEGLDALRQAIQQRLGERAVSVQANILALQPRHESALRDALAGLEDALLHVAPEAHALDEIELVAGSMRQALDLLAGLGGQLTPDDVIGRVFSTFCVGK